MTVARHLSHRTDIRWRSIGAAASRIDEMLAGITAQERQEASRFRLVEDQNRFIVARSLLRSMLALKLGQDPLTLDIVRDDQGKPFLATSQDVSFSVSHSGDIVLVAVGDGEAIGVDVECHRADIDISALGRMVFTTAELEHVLTAPPAARIGRFFRQWVFKEALVKALGTGLLKDPRRFQIGQALENPDVEYVGAEDDDIGAGWQLCALNVPKGYSASLCVRPHRDTAEAVLAA